MANASKHVDRLAIHGLRLFGDTMRNISTLRKLPIKETGLQILLFPLARAKILGQYLLGKELSRDEYFVLFRID